MAKIRKLLKNKNNFLMKVTTFWSHIVSSRVGTSPLPLFRGNPPLSEANLKNYPLFLTAIQIGACKL